MKKTLAFQRKYVISKIVFLLILLALIINTASATIDTTNNEIWYSMDDSNMSGSTVINLVGGTGVNGTETSTTSTTGQFNQARAMNANTDDIEVVDSATYDGGTSISIGFWYKGTDTTAGTNWIQKGGAPTKYQWNIYQGGAGQNVVCAPMDTTGAGVAGAITATAITDGAWHHVACSIEDGVRTRLWIDGANIANSGSWVGTWNTDDTDVMKIGEGLWSSGKVGDYDDFFFYKRLLDTGDIADIIADGNPYPSSSTNFSVTAINAWDGTSLNNFSAYLNSSWFHATNGIINTGINGRLGLEFDIVLNATGYADRTYTAYNTSVDLAAVLYPANSVNITFKYEANGSVADNIDITAEFISDVHSEEANTSTGYLNLTLPYPSSYQIRYEAINYSTRIYTFSLVDGTYNEITLYLPMSNTQNVTISVIDTLNNVIEGATVKVLKYFVTTNSYSQISSQETNFEGKIVESLEIGSEFYQFIIEYDGDTVLTTEPSYIYTTAITLYVDLIANSFNEMFSLYNLYGVIDYTPNQTFTFTFTDGDNLATQGCLYAYRVAWDTFTKVNTSCTAGAAGTASFDVDNTSGYVYLLKGYITKGGEDKYVTNLWFSYADVVDDENSLFLVTILVLVFALIAFWRIEAAVVMTGFSLLLVTIIGIVNIPIVVGVYMFVLSLVVSFIIAKKKGGGE